jgi:hypothetical protein
MVLSGQSKLEEGGAMSPLRMPQHLADPPQTDSGEAVLKFELMEELETLHRLEDRVEATLAALRDHDAEQGATAERGALVDAAAQAVWRLVVQHEACDCCDHAQLMARYGVPAEVLARLGAVGKAA